MSKQRGSRIANHVWLHNHAIDFENASIIDKVGFGARKTLEAWHNKPEKMAKLTTNVDNNSYPLPGQYNILFNKYLKLFGFLFFRDLRRFFLIFSSFLSIRFLSSAI